MKLSDIKIVTEANADICKKYRRDTETCKTGCPAKKVKKGNPCPYDIGEQDDCPCYVG